MRRLQPREAFIATLRNFFARLAVALTFVPLVALTWALARATRGVLLATAYLGAGT
jgi:hypothetical protein